MRSRIAVILIATVATLAACGGGADAVVARPTTLAVSGRSNENVSLAASDRMVVAVWSATVGDTTDIFAATSHDAAASFGAPVRVNAVAGQARTGGEQPPRVALVPRAGATPGIVVLWTARTPEGTRLLTAESADGGLTFGASRLVAGSDGAGNRGWESLAVDDSGRATALWLDHRNTAATMAHRHGEAPAATTPPVPKPDPVGRAGLSQLWAARLDGAVPAQAITGGVCYCCKTSLVAWGPNLYSAWRHVFAGNQRDIAFAASRDGGRHFETLVRVSEDRWQFDGCPENGPALAVDREGGVHVAWVTPLDGAEGGPLTLYHAMSRDGLAFSARAKIATSGAAGHVQLAALRDGTLFLAWDEVLNGSRRIRAARGTVGTDGAVAFTPVSTGDAAGTYPAITAVGSGGVALAWVDRSEAGSTIAVAVHGVR